MLNGSIDDRGRFQAKEVEFHQTGIFDPFHLELRYEVIAAAWVAHHRDDIRSEEHTSELQSLMRISYAVFCLKKKKLRIHKHEPQTRSITLRNRKHQSSTHK